jgi:hypothetical protein
MIRSVVLCALSCIALAVEVAWPDLPDPIGLGPRLATIAWLKDHGVTVRAGATDEDVMAAYDQLTPSGTGGIRNRSHLDAVIVDRQAETLALATSSGAYVATWSGDWTTRDTEWTGTPNLARWSIRLIYQQPDGMDRTAAGGILLMQTSEAEGMAMRWVPTAIDGRSFRDLGAVDGTRSWRLNLPIPPLEPLTVIAAAAELPGVRRTWTVRYDIAQVPASGQRRRR